MNIGILGFGHLSRAFAGGLIKKECKDQIRVSSKTKETKILAKKDFKLESFEKNTDLATWSDILVLSVKPHAYKDIARELEEVDLSEKIIISFLAGVSIEDLENAFSYKLKLARVIPNIAMNVNSSISAITFSSTIKYEEKNMVTNLMEMLGQVSILSEDDLNKFSSISSSGLGFIAYLYSAFEEAYQELGIKEEEKKKIISGSFLSILKMAEDKDFNANELAEKVATKGGSTIVGLDYMKDHKVKEAISSGICESYKKVLSLGRKNPLD